MAIFLPSPLVGAISGPVGGVTFVTSGRGQVVKGPATTCVRQSPLQLEHRARVQRYQCKWRGLTSAQRDQWRVAAVAVRRVNRLGVVRQMTGFQLFMSINLNNVSWKSYDYSIPPAVLVTPPCAITSLYASAVPSLQLKVRGASGTYPVRCWVAAGTNEQSGDRGLARGCRVLGYYDVAVGGVDLTGKWNAVFGSALRSGQWITVGVMAVNTAAVGTWVWGRGPVSGAWVTPV